MTPSGIRRTVRVGLITLELHVADTAPESQAAFFCARVCRECGGYKTREGKKPAGPRAGYQLPVPALFAGDGLISREHVPNLIAAQIRTCGAVYTPD